MSRLLELRKALRKNAFRSVLLVIAVAGGPASAQFVISGPSGDEPYIVCRAWVSDSNTLYASETVANNPNAKERFRYHAKQWGGENVRIDCQEYRAMTPEYDRTWRPGNSYQNYRDETMTVEAAAFLPDGWDTTPTPDEIEKDRLAKSKGKDPVRSKSEENSKPAKSAAQIAAEEAAARKAKYEAEFQAKQAEYERKLAEQQKMVEDYKKAQDEVERTKAANQAKAEEAAAKFKAEQEAYAETARRHAERQAAAQKLLEDWDKRHGLAKKSEASTATDANRCVTAPEMQSNASFKGNTAASVINGCGEPVDVRICLMTGKGWNCGATWGLASQAKWSWSSFDATGQVFVDAHVSSSPRAFASPQ